MALRLSGLPCIDISLGGNAPMALRLSGLTALILACGHVFDDASPSGLLKMFIAIYRYCKSVGRIRRSRHPAQYYRSLANPHFLAATVGPKQTTE